MFRNFSLKYKLISKCVGMPVSAIFPDQGT